MTHLNLVKRLSERLSSGVPIALVTVTSSEGSVPRETGAKMLVAPDSSIEGTIGGGRMEAVAISDAVAALADGKSLEKTYELEPKALGMYCGGKVTVFIDVFSEPLKLVILGGGHIGEKTAELASFLGVAHWVVDDREEFSRKERFPHARSVTNAPPDQALKTLKVDEKTAIAIVTRCHGFDLRCLVASLATPAFYIGMIGSRTKTTRLFDLCEKRGLDPGADPRVHAPIGLDLGLSTPEAIALSILGEVLQQRYQASGKPLSLEKEGATL